MNIKPVIKWSGSKRSQASEIVNKIPKHNKYFEPFLGGGSIMWTYVNIVDTKSRIFMLIF